MNYTIVYTFSAGIAFTLVILLLLARLGELKVNADFARMKRFLAYAAFLELLADTVSLCFAVKGADMNLVDSFIEPFISSNQLILLTYSLLGITRYRSIAWTSVFKLTTPLDIILLFYIGSYLGWNPHGDFFSIDNYVSFLTSSPVSKVFAWIIHICLFSVIACCVFFLIVHSVRYRKRLEDFFSGIEVVGGQRFVHLTNCYVAFFILAFFDIMLSSPVFNSLFAIVNPFLYIALSVILLSLGDLYKKKTFVIEPEFGRSTSTLEPVSDNNDVGIATSSTNGRTVPINPTCKRGSPSPR